MGGGIKPGMGISFVTPPLVNDVEVTGPLAASFWVSSSTEDMDLFLTMRNFDPEGNEVLETANRARRCRWRRVGCVFRIGSSIPN